MNRLLKITSALALSCILSFSSLSVLAVQAFADDAEQTQIQKGDFIYAPHTYTEGDLRDIYYYSDNFFEGSAEEYNAHLATMSMIVCSASISSQEPGVDYRDKSRNLQYLFREIDFSGFEVNEYYMQKPEEQSMGAAVGYKIIGEGEDAYTVLAIIPRSAGYEKEWAGNFTVGTDGVHKGFATGRDILLEFAQTYVEENKEYFEGEVKVWTTGYSRGAGVANLLAAYLDDNPTALGIEVAKENIFAYTFGTPSNVEYADEAEKLALQENYKNIHNRYSDYDIISYVPFKNWNFTCYGQTTLFDVDNAEKKAEMLKFLENTNKTIYDLYTAENSTADPDNFTPVMAQYSEEEGLQILPDSKFGIAADQKTFLDERVSFLVDNLVLNREVYCNDGYEYALQRLNSLYFGMSAMQSQEFFAGISHDLPTLAASYYCYFLAEFYLTNDTAWENAVDALVQSLPILELYIQQAASDEEMAKAEWCQFAVEFIASEEYVLMKELLDSPVWLQDEEDRAQVKATMQEFAVGMTAQVLGSGVSAMTIEDEEEKQTLLSTMTSEEVAKPLTKFFVYLLMGTEEEEIQPFTLDSKNVALAVTFCANAGRYMRAHNNEIILSWLRTEDSYYTNENWHTHTLEIKWDENGHWQECECGHKEEVCGHIFDGWKEKEVVDDKQIFVRECPCGYTESKEVPIEKEGLGALTIVMICIGGAAIVAASVVAVVVIKKRKTIQ